MNIIPNPETEDILKHVRKNYPIQNKLESNVKANNNKHPTNTRIIFG